MNQSSALFFQFTTKPEARFAYRVIRFFEKHGVQIHVRRTRVEKNGKLYVCPQFKDRRSHIRHKCGYCWTGNIDPPAKCRICGAVEYVPKIHSAREFRL